MRSVPTLANGESPSVLIGNSTANWASQTHFYLPQVGSCPELPQGVCLLEYDEGIRSFDFGDGDGRSVGDVTCAGRLERKNGF